MTTAARWHEQEPVSTRPVPRLNQTLKQPFIVDMAKRALIAALVEELREYLGKPRLAEMSILGVAAAAERQMVHIPVEALENREADSLAEECKRRGVCAGAAIVEVWDAMHPGDGGSGRVRAELERREGSGRSRGPGYEKLLSIGHVFGYEGSASL